jgi:hypothetical protein
VAALHRRLQESTEHPLPDRVRLLRPHPLQSPAGTVALCTPHLERGDIVLGYGGHDDRRQRQRGIMRTGRPWAFIHTARPSTTHSRPSAVRLMASALP